MTQSIVRVGGSGFGVQSSVLIMPYMSVCLLLLDRSGSMETFGDEPMKQVNSFLAEMAGDENAAVIVTGVATFANTHRFDLPFAHAHQRREMDRYKAAGSTLLHATVADYLQRLRELVELRDAYDLKTTVMVNVLTDGEDTCSSHESASAVHRLGTECRQSDWHLRVFGFGVDGLSVARQLGFVGGRHAPASPNCGGSTVNATRDNFRHTITTVGQTVRTTTRTGMTMINFPPSSPVPPPPSSH